jgi:2-amino-4-hydroxy-6-hydroxymethyldihydropteridine diphosphokinase
MSLNQVLIGLGSNLEDPKNQLRKVIEVLRRHPDMTLKSASSLYCSRPQGPQDQDDFVNAVVWIETPLDPLTLLSKTQTIEDSFGRVKTRHWGERIIDLDILFFNSEQITERQPNLTIPHPYALKRDFVLIPAIEIASQWQLPDSSKLSDYEATCLKHDLKRIPA